MMRGAAAGGGAKTPDAVNWADIIDGGTNAAQTITGITVPITLSIIRTAGDTGFMGRWVKNAVAQGGFVSVDSAVTVEVADDDTLAWESDGSGAPAESATLTVTNSSTGGTVLDTFVVSTTI